MGIGRILSTILPESLRGNLYYRKHRALHRVEALPGVCFDLAAHSGSEVWRKRLTTKEGHEPGLCKWFQRNLRPDDVVFEIGSCFGFFPSLLSTLSPEVEIHAFEPNWKLFAFVRANNRPRRSGKLWVVNRAFVGDRDEAPDRITLDSYCAKRGVLPTLVKIDVDGPEQLILQGARKLIEGRKTQFLIELHPKELPKFGGSIEGFLEKFPADYRMAVLTELRDGGDEWREDLSGIEGDACPYLAAGPAEIFRI